jgi:hypothetical protein
MKGEEVKEMLQMCRSILELAEKRLPDDEQKARKEESLAAMTAARKSAIKGDRFEVRQQRLKMLMDEQCGGKYSELARKIDRAESYTGRLFYPKGKKGAKNVGEKLADEITEKFGLPRGWLDMDNNADPRLAQINQWWPHLPDHYQEALYAATKALAELPVPVDEQPSA